MRKIHNDVNIDTDDDAALQLAFETVLPPDVLTDDDDELNGKTNESHIVASYTPHASPSIKQKVKYIPPNQFVHLKPPPINTQKIYVKQQNGNQKYTLGVNNIGSGNVPVIHNKLITVKNKEPSNHIQVVPIDEDIPLTPNPNDELDKIDIFDIPILFADNDGNIMDDDQQCNEASKTTEESQAPLQPPPPSKSLNTIEILSDTIIKGPTIINGIR